MKTLVIGLGTGRCGTRTLASILNDQVDSNVTHEGLPLGRRGFIKRPLPWSVNQSAGRKAINRIAHRKAKLVGDVALYYLPYVCKWLEDSQLEQGLGVQIRCVCLKRDKRATVKSFMAKTKGRNHWSRRSRAKKDPRWDRAFPKYDISKKREAIERYWEDYYQVASELSDKFPLKIQVYDMNYVLNTEEGQANMLSFVGVNPKAQILVTGRKCNVGRSR